MNRHLLTSLVLGFSAWIVTHSVHSADELLINSKVAGSFKFSDKYVGREIKIIAWGGGGGGSGSCENGIWAKSGAGGGSGGRVTTYHTIRKPLSIDWEIGGGGDGGASCWWKVQPTRNEQPTHGYSGSDTVVEIGGSGNREIRAAGGSGGKYLGPFVFSTVVHDLPSQGGYGGFPNGVDGQYGSISKPENVSGGIGGAHPDVTYGAGGNGAMASYVANPPPNRNGPVGGKGNSGRVEIYFADPTSLSKTNIQFAERQINSGVIVDFLLIAQRKCKEQGLDCPQSDFDEFTRIISAQNISQVESSAALARMNFIKNAASIFRIFGSFPAQMIRMLIFDPPPVERDIRSILDPDLATLSMVELVEKYMAAHLGASNLEGVKLLSSQNLEIYTALRSQADKLEKEIALRKKYKLDGSYVEPYSFKKYDDSVKATRGNAEASGGSGGSEPNRISSPAGGSTGSGFPPSSGSTPYFQDVDVDTGSVRSDSRGGGWKSPFPQKLQ